MDHQHYKDLVANLNQRLRASEEQVRRLSLLVIQLRRTIERNEMYVQLIHDGILAYRRRVQNQESDSDYESMPE